MTMQTKGQEESKKYTKIKLTEFHSKAYLDRLKETTYKDKKVVFILPNNKEVKYE